MTVIAYDILNLSGTRLPVVYTATVALVKSGTYLSNEMIGSIFPANAKREILPFEDVRHSESGVGFANDGVFLALCC